MDEDVLNNVAQQFNFTNFGDHPTNRKYKVFSFKTEEEADHFESLLKESAIEYERDTEAAEEEKKFFAVKKEFFKQALKLNFLTSAKFRTPLVNDVYLRWILVLGGLFLIGLGFISYIKS